MRRGAAIAAIATVAMSSLAAAVEPPAVNLGFESWNAARTLPVGWGVDGTPGYRIAADCGVATEGGCSLVIASAASPKADQFSGVSQALPARLAAGHALTLSGTIRTDSVKDGWAGLWMRVDGPNGAVFKFDNMEDRGPHATTAWQRFSISLPVAANARRILIGVLLAGTGTAWFDDLRVDVDAEVTTAAADIPALPLPPRPVASAVLADDKALALDDASRPAIDPAWRDDVRARSHPFRSLFSDDFADLQFLKPLLAGKRVVQLGESAHGVAEFNWAKARLVRFLHRQMGYDVLAFESSMSGCAIADGGVATRSPRDVMNGCIFGVWRTSEVLGLFDYLDATRKAGTPLTLAGFDSQNSGAAGADVAARFQVLLRSADPALAARVAVDEARLVDWYANYGRGEVPGDQVQAMLADYQAAERVLRADRDRTVRPPAMTPAILELATQETAARRALARQLGAASVEEGMRIRDRGMADNLDFLLDRLYPSRKVIVWAHNAHVAKAQWGKPEPQAMGAWVAQRRGAQVYTIGLFMGRGVAATNGRDLYEIKPPAAGSLEAVMAGAGRTMSFVDFSQATRSTGSAWMFQPIQVREWGTQVETLVPADSYDAVLYIDTVTPPDYLK